VDDSTPRLHSADDGTANPRIQARLTSELAGWLDNRAGRMFGDLNRNRQAIAELGLWRSVLDIELRRIRLTLAQANCIADVLNGCIMAPAVSGRPGMVYAACYEEFQIARETGGDISSYGAKHGPEGCDPAKWEQDLLDYLGKLSPAADHALRDAIAGWWDFPGWDTSETDEDAESEEMQIRCFATYGIQIREERPAPAN
jgi:hypothetical protein